MVVNKDPTNRNLSKELQDALKDVVLIMSKDDKAMRERQLAVWRRYEFFFHGIQNIYWSESANDWIDPTGTGGPLGFLSDQEPSDRMDDEVYDYIINIVKAHGESIISALSAHPPTVRFIPDDAETEEDIIASKAKDRIAELILNHNKGKLLIAKVFYYLYTQGTPCSYVFIKTDESYGTAKIPVYGKKKFKDPDQFYCKDCAILFPQEQNQQAPSSEQNSLEEPQHEQQIPTCPECGGENLEPKAGEEVERTIKVGEEDKAKSRVFIIIYGPLNVAFSPYAKEHEDLGYLNLETDIHYAKLREMYDHIKDKINPGGFNSLERDARSPIAKTYLGSESSSFLTHRITWLRPWAFNCLDDLQKTQREELKKLFPLGCKATFINDDLYAEAVNEDFDECWTIYDAVTATHVHNDPLVQPLIPVQEMKNTLTNLEIETIEHGIPSSFADPAAVDFNEYGKHPSLPGMVYPAKRPPGTTSLDQSFFTEPKAALSKEVGGVKQSLEIDGQFVVGDFPSLFGGPSQGKSRTLGEYQQSRVAALQRLLLRWTEFIPFWENTVKKAVNKFIGIMLEDEKFVKRDGDNFVNIWIRKAELSGNAGSTEVEAADDLPMSIAQKRDAIKELIQLNNDFVNSALFHPQNTKIIAETLSFPEFYIPGEDQRSKQAAEIQELLKTGPISPEQSTIAPEFDIDDNAVHLQVLKSFMVSSVGLFEKAHNPEGYANLTAHAKQHELLLSLQTQGQTERSQPGEQPETNAERTV